MRRLDDGLDEDIGSTYGSREYRGTQDRHDPRGCGGPVATPYLWTDPAKITRREFLWLRHLARKMVSATIAPGGLGKTALKRAESLCMVSGRDLLGAGHKGPRRRVWLLNLEDTRDEMVRGIQATAMHYKLQPDDLSGLFLDLGREQDFVIAETAKSGATIRKPIVDSIIAAITANRIDVVIVDPFISSHRVQENDNSAIDMVVKQWARVADATSCAIDLVHHSRKLGDSEVTTESARGGKALTDACRSVMVLNRMSPDEGERAGVDNPRLYFRTLQDKTNLAPPADKSDWYRLESVDLGNGTQFEPGDHVGVVVPWTWPDPMDSVTVADLRAAQAAVAAGRWRENSQATDWVGVPIGRAMKLNPADPKEKARIKAALKVWVASGMFVVVEGKDEARRTKAFVEVGEAAND